MMNKNTEDEFNRWARFGVDQDGIKYIPVGGTCIMAYLLDIKNDSLLLGVIDGEVYSDYWLNEWGVYIHRENIWRDKWFIPSGFLHYGEHPSKCAERLVKNMLNGDVEKIELFEIVSFTQKSKYYPGYNHWHLCFVYKTTGLNFSKGPWFKELKHVPFSSLKFEDIGVAGGPVLKTLNLV